MSETITDGLGKQRYARTNQLLGKPLYGDRSARSTFWTST
jgi:hypothetical protein